MTIKLPFYRTLSMHWVCVTAIVTIAAPACAVENDDHISINVIEVNAEKIQEISHLTFDFQADQFLNIKKDDLLKAGITSLNDLRRIDPRIATISNRDRGRNEGIQLRGLSGKRVSTYLDGIPLGDTLGELFELSMLSSLQVHFGPASSRRASGALGGYVDYYSLKPRDLLTKTGEGQSAQQIQSFASSLNDSIGFQYTYATQIDEDEILFAVNTHSKHELEPVGDARSWPQERLALSGLIVYTQALDHDTHIDYTVDVYNEDIASTIRNDYYFEDRAEDRRLRARTSIHYQQNNDTNELIHSAQLFIQHAQSIDKTISLDFGNQDDGFDRRQVDSNEFEQTLLGAFYHHQNIITDNKRWFLGGELLYTESSDLQSGYTKIYSSDSHTQSAETRSFPITQALSTGLYAEYQHELNQWTFGAGLRLDTYHLRLDIDDAYERNLAGVHAPNDLDDAAITARLHLVRHLTEIEQIHFKIAQGYRNGRYDEANQAFTNFANGYTISPNPDLEPERGLSVEFGYKQEGAFEITAHHTWYDDFISSQFVGVIPNNTGIGPHATLSQYQDINIDRARIYGIDLKGNHEIGINYDIFYTASWIDGENSKTGAGIDELQPFHLQAGLRRYALNHELEIEFLVRYAAEKRDVERSNAFIPDNYLAFDARLHWTASENVKLSLNIENIFDKHYWEWSDVSSLNHNSSDAQKDYYAAYPFHLSLSTTITW